MLLRVKQKSEDLTGVTVPSFGVRVVLGAINTLKKGAA